MYLSYNPDLIVYILLTAAIVILLFFLFISLRMILSLSRVRDMRRKKEMEAFVTPLSETPKNRFLQDMGKK